MNTANARSGKKTSPKIIKKYGNRKLYDTEQSSYVVLKDIEKMIRDGEEIRIIDNETHVDITVPTFTQIIFSSEKKSKLAVPVHVLKSIIREGDGSISSFLAKLGIFSSTTGEKKRNKASSSSSTLRGGKAPGERAGSQMINRWLSSGDESGSGRGEDSVPELPGSHRQKLS